MNIHHHQTSEFEKLVYMKASAFKSDLAEKRKHADGRDHCEGIHYDEIQLQL